MLGATAGYIDAAKGVLHTSHLSLHTRRGLGGDNPEDINGFADLGVFVVKHKFSSCHKNKILLKKRPQLT